MGFSFNNSPMKCSCYDAVTSEGSDKYMTEQKLNLENNQPSGIDLVRAVSGNQPPRIMASSYQRTREMTLDELMLENRVIFLIGEINQASAARVMMQMLYLEDQKRGQQINLYINSPGGAVDDTLAMYDTMQFISSDVATYCIGRAYSGAAVLLCSGEKGKRHILPHAKVMIHQPYGGITGQTTDIQIQAEQIINSKATLNKIIADHTGQPLETVSEDGERDKYFTATEAKEYGLVDEVFEHHEDKKKD
jgi:ATP-dependent Clp protease protease subunit